MKEQIKELIKKVENIENPFAFSLDGKPIPKWEKQFDGFEEARVMILQAIRKEYLNESSRTESDPGRI
jgi:sulfur carrier protein ThiS